MIDSRGVDGENVVTESCDVVDDDLLEVAWRGFASEELEFAPDCPRPRNGSPESNLRDYSSANSATRRDVTDDETTHRVKV